MVYSNIKCNLPPVLLTAGVGYAARLMHCIKEMMNQGNNGMAWDCTSGTESVAKQVLS